jgi:hypothetical protein
MFSQSLESFRSYGISFRSFCKSFAEAKLDFAGSEKFSQTLSKVSQKPGSFRRSCVSLLRGWENFSEAGKLYRKLRKLIQPLQKS